MIHVHLALHIAEIAAELSMAVEDFTAKPQWLRSFGSAGQQPDNLERGEVLRLPTGGQAQGVHAKADRELLRIARLHSRFHFQ